MKDFKELYIKALSSTSPLNFDFKEKMNWLSIFTGRDFNEIISLIKDEEVKELGRKIRSSVRISDESNMNVETDADTTFSLWLISEHFKVNTKIPYILQRLFDKIIIIESYLPFWKKIFQELRLCNAFWVTLGRWGWPSGSCC